MSESSTSSDTKSIWDHALHKRSFPELTENLKTDICIVGGGITGVSTAYMLAKEGKKVMLIEKGKISGGETGYTTAHLSTVLDKRYFELESLHGMENVKKAIESHAGAIDLIHAIIKKEQIDCDFVRVDGYLFLGGHDKEETLDRELETVRKFHIKDVQKQEKNPQGADCGPSLKFPQQAQFHPVKYLMALTDLIQKNGGQIYENSEVHDIHETNDGVKIKLENGVVIEAEQAVIATNVPFNDRYKIHMKQAAYRTYVIGVEVPNDTIETALFWDTEEPYHYVRLLHSKKSETSHNILIVGGEDHRTGQGKKNDTPYARLFEWARKKFPVSKDALKYQWSGQVIEPIDTLAFIGLNPGNKRVYIATGFSGSGMTYGAMASQMITDQILGRKNPYTELYDPCRKNIKAAGAFLEDGLSVTDAYLDVVRRGDQVTPKDLPKETGAVINEGLKKIAIYRDKHGKVCKYSAVCPHLGCIVRWNGVESTWDCPCHGSRFNTRGEVINGPATAPLKPIENQ